MFPVLTITCSYPDCIEKMFCLSCYKLIQRFRVTGLFAGQYNTKLHGTITDVICTIVVFLKIYYVLNNNNTFKLFL